jgi:hypothetical protein
LIGDPVAWRYWERRFTLGVYAIVLVLLWVPIVSVRVPPLMDYPNHLARMHILAAFDSSSALQTNYVVQWKLAPYLAMDLVVPPLTRFMPIYTAGRVFLCAILSLTVLGTAAVNAALFRRLSVWPAGSALFAYNMVFSLGFTNYLAGVGIALVAFAVWILLSRGSAFWLISAGSLLSLIVFVCHFFAFFAYGLCVVGYEAGVWMSNRDRLLPGLLRRLGCAACTAVVPLVFFFCNLQAQQGGVTWYGTWPQKLAAIGSPFAFPGDRFSCTNVIFSLWILLSGLALRRLHWAPAMRICLAGVFVAACVMPTWLSGVWAVDYRLPIFLVLLMIAGCAWKPANFVVPLTGLMIALLSANMVSVVQAWRPVSADVETYRAAQTTIPLGARVIAFRGDNASPDAIQYWRHMPALAVIERDAYLPDLFKNPMDPVGAAPALKSIDVAQGVPITLSELAEGADPALGPATLGQVDTLGFRKYWGDWPHHYDYAIGLLLPAHPSLPEQLRLLVSGRTFAIYRIVN